MRTSSSGLIVVPVCCKSQFLPTNPPTLLQTQISPSTPIHGKCTSRCRYYTKYKHKSPTAQDVFQPISGFISSAGVTGKCRMLSHVSWTKCSQVADPYGTYLHQSLLDNFEYIWQEILKHRVLLDVVVGAECLPHLHRGQTQQLYTQANTKYCNPLPCCNS